MEPISKSQKQKILKDNPLATPELIGEYEKLLVEKFANPPGHASSAEERATITNRNKRIKELYKLLFPQKS